MRALCCDRCETFSKWPITEHGWINIGGGPSVADPVADIKELLLCPSCARKLKAFMHDCVAVAQ